MWIALRVVLGARAKVERKGRGWRGGECWIANAQRCGDSEIECAAQTKSNSILRKVGVDSGFELERKRETWIASRSGRRDGDGAI